MVSPGNPLNMYALGDFGRDAAAEEKGLTAINTTIRADNVGGLAFYGRLGFTDNEVHRAMPLSDGTPIDRISKRYALQRGD